MDLFPVSLRSLANVAIRESWRLEEPTSSIGELPLSLAWLELAVEIKGDARSGVHSRSIIRGAGKSECRRCLIPNAVTTDTRFDVQFRLGTEVPLG